MEGVPIKEGAIGLQEVGRLAARGAWLRELLLNCMLRRMTEAQSIKHPEELFAWEVNLIIGSLVVKETLLLEVKILI